MKKTSYAFYDLASVKVPTLPIFRDGQPKSIRILCKKYNKIQLLSFNSKCDDVKFIYNSKVNIIGSNRAALPLCVWFGLSCDGSSTYKRCAYIRENVEVQICRAMFFVETLS